MKKWSKEIHFFRIHILLTNFLHLGFSIKKTPLGSGIFHINLWSCQIAIT